MKKIFQDTLAFIMRNLKKIQNDQNINSPGRPEISKIVFEELLVNALIHRDYFVSAVIRIFIFDDRIEIISPGHLPNNLTVEKIRTGNSNIRNPILASFIAKKMLPYRGLGSGIQRALEEWKYIDFVDDREGCLFKVIIKRDLKVQKNHEIEPLNEPLTELQIKIVNFIKMNPKISYGDLSEAMHKGRSTIMRNIQKLKNSGLLLRVGSKKTGYWQVKK